MSSDLPQGPIHSRLDDQKAMREINELWRRVNGIRVTKDIIEPGSVAEGLGKAFKDGQLEVLNRLLAGVTGQGIKLSRDKDDYTAYFIKVNRTGDAFNVLYVDGDMSSAYTAKIVSAAGGGLQIQRTGGGTDPLLSLDDDGSFSGHIITTTSGAHLTNGGSWVPGCSRKGKKGFVRIAAEKMLAGIRALKIRRWRYKKVNEVHIGPCREDVQAAFGLKEVSDYDLAGIALAGVQCLLARVEALEKEAKRWRSERR